MVPAASIGSVKFNLKEISMKHPVPGSMIRFCAFLILMMGLACHPTNSRTFTIPADGVWSTSWFETGITLREGQTVVFSATGQVRPSTGQDIYAGPDGTTEVPGWQQNYCYNSDFPHEAIIARIGGGDILLIGSGEQFQAATAGVLEIGVNDTDPANNEGSFEVEISW